MARDDDFLAAAAVAAKALQTARQALARAPEPGPPGPAGERGPAGRDGADGRDGAPGPQGEPGAQGPQGPQGVPGPAGPQGAPGPQGERGQQGEQGPAGADGRNGIDGHDGRDGAPGRRGADGRDGRDAVTLAPARVLFERDAQRRTQRMTIISASGRAGLEVLPIRDAITGLIVAADIGLLPVEVAA